MEEEREGFSYLIFLEEIVSELRSEVVDALLVHEEVLAFMRVVEDLDGIASKIGNHVPGLVF